MLPRRKSGTFQGREIDARFKSVIRVRLMNWVKILTDIFITGQLHATEPTFRR
jgi:hypothetical protein